MMDIPWSDYFPDPGPKDWPEDFGLENGNYFCPCGNCGATFRGHKRRVLCRECAAKPPDPPAPELVPSGPPV